MWTAVTPVIVGIICLTLIILVWLTYWYDRPISVKLWFLTIVAPRRNDRLLHPPTRPERPPGQVAEQQATVHREAPAPPESP